MPVVPFLLLNMVVTQQTMVLAVYDYRILLVVGHCITMEYAISV